eukprot:TRINITY_DN85010_c0_g1_i1.p1 TRINITY_DN85010_c0_g1~~TRINITY_DN85010_c0_g1_i1.p1  ORF type:complete len:181 (-),score=25.89 TRINITY_DN85010_c0_g1_i1:259-801(-)
MCVPVRSRRPIRSSAFYPSSPQDEKPKKEVASSRMHAFRSEKGPRFTYQDYVDMQNMPAGAICYKTKGSYAPKAVEAACGHDHHGIDGDEVKMSRINNRLLRPTLLRVGVHKGMDEQMDSAAAPASSMQAHPGAIVHGDGLQASGGLPPIMGNFVQVLKHAFRGVERREEDQMMLRANTA